jgi:hypothetical protein
MPRVTIDATLARCRQVEELELRGATPAAIAASLQADIRTVRRDLVWLAGERARATDIRAARYRLLAAAQTVEVAAWKLYAALPAEDANGKLGALGKALAAQERAAALLGAIEQGALAEEVAALQEQVAQLAAERGGLRAVSS